MSAASVIVETDATDSVKITIGARTLQRTAGEPLQKALGRLAPKKRRKARKPPLPRRHPRRRGCLMPPTAKSTPRHHCWMHLSLGKWLELDGARLPVALNPSTVVSVECYGEPTAGSPLMPLAELKRAEADDVSYRYSLDGAGRRGMRHRRRVHARRRCCRPHAGRGSVGRRLRVTRDLGKVAPRPVAAPLDCHDRPRGGDRRAGRSIRVVTYNVLADAYRHRAGTPASTPLRAIAVFYTLPAEARRIPMAIDDNHYHAPSIIALGAPVPKSTRRRGRTVIAHGHVALRVVARESGSRGSAS